MSRRTRAWGVALLVLGAFALRLVHLRWGFPDVLEEATPVREAIGMWGAPGGAVDPNPHFFKYPSFTFYLNFLVQAGWYLWLSLTGAVSSLNDFRQVLAQDLPRAVLLGRVLQAAAGALVVVPTFLLARRTLGAAAGWIAALLVAVLPLAVEQSQLVSPDIFLALFAAAALASAVGIVERGERSDYLWCALWIGLATAAKYPGAFLLAALFTAHGIRNAREKGGPAGFLLSDLLWQGLATGAAVFALATPYVLLDLGPALADIAFERRHMMIGHLGREHGRAFGYYLGRAIPLGWTPPVAVAAVLGAALLLGRRETRSRTLPTAVFTGLLLLVLGSWRMAAPRYVLPLLPVAAAWAAAAAVLLPRMLPGGRRGAAAAAALLGVCLVAWPAVRTTHALAFRGRDDSRVAAGTWIRAHVPAGSTLLVERYGPEPDPDRYHVLYLPFHAITPHIYDAAYSPPLYATFDYLVFSSGVSARYLAAPREYPAQAAFYRAMERAFSEVAVFSSGEYLGPTVRVFKRRPEAPLPTLEGIPDSFFARLAGNRPLAEYFSALGTVLVKQGKELLGFRMLRKAADMDPENAKVWGNLGAMDLRTGHYEDALVALRKARELEPGNPEVAYNLGTYFQKTGELHQAEDAFRRAITLKPDLEPAYLGLARVMVEDDRYGEARALLQEFLRRFPRSPERASAEAALGELSRMGTGKTWGN